MIKKKKNKVSLNPDAYADRQTGMKLSKELNNGELTVKEETGLITISSTEYLRIDSNALRYMSENLSNSDFKAVLSMANMIKTEFNIVFNHNIPHTNHTLAKHFDINIDMLRKLINRLSKKGIITYAMGIKTGYEGKIYFINPTVARKRTDFDEGIMTMFNDLSR